MSANGAYVLVVDDEVEFRDLLSRILGAAGYRVETATNSHEALSLVAAEAPAVLVSDVHMPGPTGVWLTQQIRERCPHTAMVLATSDDSVPPSDSMRSGIVGYIVKPYSRQQVLKSVSDGFRWWSERSGLEVPALVAPAAAAAAPAPAVARHAAPPPAAPAPPARHETYRPPSQNVTVTVSKQTIVIVLIVLALLAAGAYWWWSSQAPQRAIARVVAASGTVTVYDSAGMSLGQGSGFFVAPDVFVTNHHVVKGGVRADIVADDARFQSELLVAMNVADDLLLLRTSSPSASYLALAAAPPRLGDPVSVYGAPLGFRGTLSTGIVSSAPDAASNRMQITAPISPGSSGSPVFDADGAVIGVATSFNNIGQGLNFAVPAHRLRALLAEQGAPRALIVAATP